MKYTEVKEHLVKMKEDEIWELLNSNFGEEFGDERSNTFRANWIYLVKISLKEKDFEEFDSKSEASRNLVREKIALWRTLDISSESMNHLIEGGHASVMDFAAEILCLDDLFIRKPELLGMKRLPDGTLQMPADGLPPKSPVEVKTTEQKDDFIWTCRGMELDMDDILIKYLQDYLDDGEDINKRDKNGETGLIAAADKGRLGVVKFLIEKGADVNASDHQGNTALMKRPGHYYYLAVAEALIKAGAKVNEVNMRGETALMRAVRGCNVDGVNFLLQKGSNTLLKDQDGNTALSLAKKSKQKFMIQFIKAYRDAQKKLQPRRGFFGGILGRAIEQKASKDVRGHE